MPKRASSRPNANARGVTRARIVLLALPLAFLAACGGSPVPPAQNYGTIQGRAYDTATNQAVAGVVVTVDFIDTATTSASGNYTINNIALGQYDLTVQPPAGYTVGDLPDASGSIVAGQSITIDIPLTKQ
jgi:hypothetical protein